MSRRFTLGLLWALLTLFIAGGAAAYAYHLGTLATVSAAAGGGYVVHPYGGYWGWGPGFGFFPFGFLVPLLFLFLIFGFFRWVFFWGMFRGGRWNGGPGPRGYDDHRRQRFEEWHREAHESPRPQTPGDEPPART